MKMKPKNITRLLVVVILVSVTPGFAEVPHAGLLRVNVVLEKTDVKSGTVKCDLYSSADGFPDTPAKAVLHSDASITSEGATCLFRGMLRGTYAVGAFHDRNGNGKMDYAIFGLPKEPFGVSNDVKSRFSSPKFSESSFVYTGGEHDLTIHLRHI